MSVAVLLDSFVAETAREKEEQRLSEINKKRRCVPDIHMCAPI